MSQDNFLKIGFVPRGEGALRDSVGFYMWNPTRSFGGAEIAVLRVAEWLTCQGIPITIVVARAEGALPFRLPKGAEFVNLKAPMPQWGAKPLFGSSVFTLAALARFFRRNAPARMIVPCWVNGWVNLWAKKLVGAPVQILIWEQLNLSASFAHSGGIYSLLAPKLVQWSYPSADALVACSQGVAEDLASLLGLPKERISVIYNPIPADIERRAEEPLDHPWFAPDQPPVILSVGRLHPQKDFPTLLKAFWQGWGCR
jgi:glycosyltransferase involved in cell wall biosynthesis